VTCDGFTPAPLVGLIRVREHCTFNWQRLDGADVRSVIVQDHHCLQCLAEARRRGFRLIVPDGGDYAG
jgi:hypothetical protein